MRSSIRGCVRLWLCWLDAVAIACILLRTAFTHLANPYLFLRSVYDYDLLPRGAAEMAAAVLPFVHIAIAIGLISGKVPRNVFRCAALLFTVYSIVQITALSRGLPIDCGCFGREEAGSPVGASSIALAIGLLFSSLAGMFCADRTAVGSTSVPLALACGSNSSRQR